MSILAGVKHIIDVVWFCVFMSLLRGFGLIKAHAHDLSTFQHTFESNAVQLLMSLAVLQEKTIKGSSDKSYGEKGA
jgi:hypothetical protein